MKIFSRMKDSIFSPNMIYTFKNDKKIFTTLYYFILVILLMIPSLIIIAFNSDIDYTTRVEIRKAFLISEEIPFKISNNTLVATKEGVKEYYNVSYGTIEIFFSDSEEFNLPSEYLNTSNILIGKDGIYIATPVANMMITSYQDFSSFEGLDFTKAKSYDQDFWNKAYDVITLVYSKFKPAIIITSIVLMFFQASFTLLIFSLILTLFARFGDANFLSFAKHWQLMIYTLSAFVIGNMLSILFGIRLFYYIGLIVSLIYSFGINQNSIIGRKE